MKFMFRNQNAGRFLFLSSFPALAIQRKFIPVVKRVGSVTPECMDNGFYPVASQNQSKL